jgi:hypothetical protein
VAIPNVGGATAASAVETSCASLERDDCLISYLPKTGESTQSSSLSLSPKSHMDVVGTLWVGEWKGICKSESLSRARAAPCGVGSLGMNRCRGRERRSSWDLGFRFFRFLVFFIFFRFFPNKSGRLFFPFLFAVSGDSVDFASVVFLLYGRRGVVYNQNTYPTHHPPVFQGGWGMDGADTSKQPMPHPELIRNPHNHNKKFLNFKTTNISSTNTSQSHHVGHGHARGTPRTLENLREP